MIYQFLSTLSLRRATIRKRQAIPIIQISIHALLAESDGGAPSSCFGRIIFLSTLSLRRATRRPLRNGRHPPNFYPRSPCGERRPEGPAKLPKQIRISIHALLAESDNRFGRPIDVQFVFLSTLSLRRATRVPLAESTAESISIHALLAESDVRLYRVPLITLPISIHALLAESDEIPYQRQIDQKNFYPRSPCGERLLRKVPILGIK